MSSPRHAACYLTAKDTPLRIAEQPPIAFGAASDSSLPSILIDATKRYQTIEGFGGAFTEAAATTLQKLNPDNRMKVLKACFDRDTGHGYSLCRTHIQSCDFALGNYAYVKDDDMELRTFSIERDRKALLPMIKAAHQYGNEPFKLFASPWSPPGWMKTTGKMNEGGKLKPGCRNTWAQCYVRYIHEYEKEGVPIWGITVQNEPAATQRWDSCIYSAGEERDFVRDHLGPALQEAGLGHVKIIIWDHNRDLLVHRAHVAYSDPRAARFVWGTGFHWYGEDKFDNLRIHHEAWPDKKLLFTEGCQEGGPHMGEWKLGERYAHSMINDLNRWTVGWVDWNLLLDETGGPNHVGNLCSAPILADTKTDQVLFQSSYYYIGHFARFIRPGARRILCATTTDHLEATAFVNPDGRLAIVVLNGADEARSFGLELDGSQAATTLPPHSIATYVVSAPA